MKNVAVGGGRRVEIRIEAQNVLNYPIFSDPTGSGLEFGSTAFGQITTTKVGPRQMMLGFKYHF